MCHWGLPLQSFMFHALLIVLHRNASDISSRYLLLITFIAYHIRVWLRYHFERKFTGIHYFTCVKCMMCRCVKCVQGGLAGILNYVTTVKGLAAIRDEVWNLLQHVSL